VARKSNVTRHKQRAQGERLVKRWKALWQLLVPKIVVLKVEHLVPHKVVVLNAIHSTCGIRRGVVCAPLALSEQRRRRSSGGLTTRRGGPRVEGGRGRDGGARARPPLAV
jgi:hypothetical protein